LIIGVKGVIMTILNELIKNFNKYNIDKSFRRGFVLKFIFTTVKGATFYKKNYFSWVELLEDYKKYGIVIDIDEFDAIIQKATEYWIEQYLSSKVIEITNNSQIIYYSMYSIYSIEVEDVTKKEQ
jgi:hypothetical protein